MRPPAKVRSFYANGANDGDQYIDHTSIAIRRLVHDLCTKRWPQRSPQVEVISGRDDFRRYARGDWEGWTKGISRRRDPLTLEPFYSLLIIDRDECGRATFSILTEALENNKPVFRFHDGKHPRLARVSEVVPEDVDDWQAGFRVQPKEQPCP